jgi:hypothetical protein
MISVAASKRATLACFPLFDLCRGDFTVLALVRFDKGAQRSDATVVLELEPECVVEPKRSTFARRRDEQRPRPQPSASTDALSLYFAFIRSCYLAAHCVGKQDR